LGASSAVPVALHWVRWARPAPRIPSSFSACYATLVAAGDRRWRLHSALAMGRRPAFRSRTQLHLLSHGRRFAFLFVISLTPSSTASRLPRRRCWFKAGTGGRPARPVRALGRPAAGDRGADRHADAAAEPRSGATRTLLASFSEPSARRHDTQTAQAAHAVQLSTLSRNRPASAAGVRACRRSTSIVQCLIHRFKLKYK
jgi:hypothetical protein